MDYARQDDHSQQPSSTAEQGSSAKQDDSAKRDDQAAKSQPQESASKDATILVRGETVRDQDSKTQSKAPSKDSNDQDASGSKPQGKEQSPPKEVSRAKVEMQNHLPVLDDDGEVGVQKEQVVTRDGKADLAFTGTLIASAAPSSAPKGKWQEYRIYETTGGKHVFSKVTRSVLTEEQDAHEAQVFDPAPSSMPSQLLKSARELTHSKPVTWTDAAVGFFGYDPLAKDLYQKVGGQFEEHVS